VAEEERGKGVRNWFTHKSISATPSAKRSADSVFQFAVRGEGTLPSHLISPPFSKQNTRVQRGNAHRDCKRNGPLVTGESGGWGL